MAFERAEKFINRYPWTDSPFIASAPMRLLAGPALTHAVSSAGGLGFLGAGIPGRDFDGPKLIELIKETAALFDENWHDSRGLSNMAVYPFGIGFLLIDVGHNEWQMVYNALRSLPKLVAAIWLFPAADMATLIKWEELRFASDRRDEKGRNAQCWIQVGTVEQAVEVATKCDPDVLVVQGADAGGHGLAASASVISLLPEVDDGIKVMSGEDDYISLVAAGGISDGRSIAAASMLGATGVVLGTRFLASEECQITDGYQNAVLAAKDGGVSTVRTSVYDTLRGTPWPEKFNGRAIKNQSWYDAQVKGGEITEELKTKFDEAMKLGDDAWGVEGRATTYAGSAVGLVKDVKPAGEIVKEIREEAKKIIRDYATSGLAREATEFGRCGSV